VELEDRQRVLDARAIHAGDLEHWFVHKGHIQVPVGKDGGFEPWFDDQHATRFQMLRHRLDGPPKVRLGFDISDAAEEASHHVKGLVELEIHHVAFMERNVREPGPRYLEQSTFEIEAFDLVVASEVLEVGSGAAGDVEQRSGPWLALLDQTVDLRCFGRVILE
jgi:hypothetical protein